MAGALIVCGCIITLSMWILSRRKKAKIAAAEEAEEVPSPQKMNSEIINPSEFQDRGPLVMQARMKGRIKHALDDDKSFSLKEIQFDPKQNEICLIGSDVEQLVGMSQISLMSGEKSAEPSKQPKKGPYPTMASELKKAEAAAKEAQRVAENERMIAICAARRRAKDEAERAAKLAAEAQQKSKLEEPKSDKRASELSKSAADTIKSEGEQAKSVPHSVPKTQETQQSTRSQVDEREQNKRSALSSPKYSHGSDRTASVSLQTHTPPADHIPARPIVLRRKLTHDGRATDAIGVRYYTQAESSDSSSRSSKRFSERPQWPEIRAHSTNI
ncbi:hypothetical protein OESDEN_12655 [Oesophagostomum dentatum]|uniref:Uncharacterized protein n=1 Tax=Oesophagostomum dentatum TaxID=61180 RepID=A0A0B1SQH3_OESDE|nr:hypothetical protein OESDEN_12655 [Oesophagostomum dentatum]